MRNDSKNDSKNYLKNDSKNDSKIDSKTDLQKITITKMTQKWLTKMIHKNKNHNNDSQKWFAKIHRNSSQEIRLTRLSKMRLSDKWIRKIIPKIYHKNYSKIH